MNIKQLRAEIFRRAKEADTLEHLHWWMSLDDCFENDELSVDDIEKAKWRATVLHWEKQPIKDLLWPLDAIFKQAKVDWEELCAQYPELKGGDTKEEK